jgi:hypothetical protein
MTARFDFFERLYGYEKFKGLSLSQADILPYTPNKLRAHERIKSGLRVFEFSSDGNELLQRITGNKTEIRRYSLSWIKTDGVKSRRS